VSTIEGSAVEFLGCEDVAVVGLEQPEPRAGEVLVETEVSAVSAGTELLVYRGHVDERTAVDEELPALDGTFSYPLRYGYAAVGTVREVGSRVDPSWRGRSVFAFNPHESHFTAEPAALYPVPDGMDPERAALFANVETAVNFALDAAPRIGERVAVFGQGVVGLLTTAVLSATPVETLVAVEPLDSRRRLAERLGADEAVDPEATDPVAAVRELTGGVDIAIEVSGHPETLETAVEATGYGGRVLVGSWYGTKRAEIGLGDHYHRGRIAVESSQVSTIAPELRGRWDRERRRETAWRWLERIDVDPLVTHRFDVADADEAYRRLTDEPDDMRQVLLTY
jgi:2-desacetyl-2-hydroxyethyl bacteriochlorophyllide A dehydrogenase